MTLSSRIQIKTNETGIHLYLPPHDMGWLDLWEELSSHWMSLRPAGLDPSKLTLWTGEWTLDTEQLQAIATLANQRHLTLERVCTQDRSTAIAAAGLGYSVDQSHLEPVIEQCAPLYLQTTLRSGKEIRHQGSVILLGDVNPGAEIIARGDILVLGRLRGVAHAGYGDNIQAVVVALRMEATQLRIADYIARLPDPLPTPVPEVAYLKHGKICLTAIPNFLDTYKSH